MGARQEVGAVIRPFAFLDVEESQPSVILPQTQLNTYFMLCLYGELLLYSLQLTVM